MNAGRPNDDAVVGLLRLVGVVDCLAAVAVVLPSSAMDSVHRALGLGALPTEPVVEYLARSLSLLYVFRGVVYLYASGDVPGRRGLVRVLAWTSVGMAVALLVIDLVAGMPLAWTRTEWLLVLVPGLLLLYFTREPRADED